MIVTPLDDVVFGDLEPDPSRSTGLHQSTIIRMMMRELEPERFGKPLDMPRIEAGYAFERMLEAGLKRKWPTRYRPQEIQCDGIAMSPDGFDPDANILEEFKCTWMSSRDCPRDRRFSHWLWQIKGYLHALKIREARLRVFFVNGDYRPSAPRLVSYALTFDDREIAENWAMLVNYAKSKGLLP